MSKGRKGIPGALAGGREELPGRRIITARLIRVRAGHAIKLTTTAPAKPAAVRRPARIAVMLALAHRLQQEITRGKYAHRAELASALGVTRTRITQLFDLTLIAPDIQKELLFLEAVDGREPLSERALRPLLRTMVWAEQRQAWAALKRKHPGLGAA